MPNAECSRAGPKATENQPDAQPASAATTGSAICDYSRVSWAWGRHEERAILHEPAQDVLRCHTVVIPAAQDTNGVRITCRTFDPLEPGRVILRVTLTALHAADEFDQLISLGVVHQDWVAERSLSLAPGH